MRSLKQQESIGTVYTDVKATLEGVHANSIEPYEAAYCKSEAAYYEPPLKKIYIVCPHCLNSQYDISCINFLLNFCRLKLCRLLI